MSLIDVIVKSGIADALDTLPGSSKGNKEAVAETFELYIRPDTSWEKRQNIWNMLLFMRWRTYWKQHTIRDLLH